MGKEMELKIHKHGGKNPPEDITDEKKKRHKSRHTWQGTLMNTEIHTGFTPYSYKAPHTHTHSCIGSCDVESLWKLLLANRTAPAIPSHRLLPW